MTMVTARVSIFAVCFLSWVAVCHAQTYPGDRCTDALKRAGICRRYEDCLSNTEELPWFVVPSICGIPGRNLIVCCPYEPMTTRPTLFPPLPWDTSSPPSTEVTTRPQTYPELPTENEPFPYELPEETLPEFKNPGDKARYWCSEYRRFCPLPVAGGTLVFPDEFPHMAAIGYGAQNHIKWKCGGTLISKNFILTAAHCLNGGKDGPAKWILLGTVKLVANESLLGDMGQIHAVIRKIRHPGYKPPAKYNDIALLEIGPALTRNARPLHSENLHPACLRTDDSGKSPSYIATGWGRTGPHEDPSDDLLKVELEVFDEATCNETFEDIISTTNKLKRGIDSTMMCAGILKGGKDTCQGDSGGPLQVPIFFKCLYEVWGVTSFGKICSFANSPSIYMKVSAFIGWIEDHVWPL